MSEPMPYRGPCEMCGSPDARHRTVDAIVERLDAGESADSISDDYAVPVSLVEVIGLAVTVTRERTLSDAAQYVSVVTRRMRSDLRAVPADVIERSRV